MTAIMEKQFYFVKPSLIVSFCFSSSKTISSNNRLMLHPKNCGTKHYHHYTSNIPSDLEKKDLFRVEITLASIWKLIKCHLFHYKRIPPLKTRNTGYTPFTAGFRCVGKVAWNSKCVYGEFGFIRETREQEKTQVIALMCSCACVWER